MFGEIPALRYPTRVGVQLVSAKKGIEREPSTHVSGNIYSETLAK